jgi:hypothetical protein
VEVEKSLFFFSSNHNSRVVTVKDGLGEIGDKFRSDVTLPMPRFEVITSHIPADDKEMTCSTKSYEISESVCFGSHWCCAP